MKKQSAKRVLSLILAGVAAILLVGCNNDTPATTTQGSTSDGPIDLTEYTVVYAAQGSSGYASSAKELAKFLGVESQADKTTEGAYPDNGGKEIVIGNTNRKESEDARATLKEKSDKKHAYGIVVTENRVAIVGTSSQAVIEAINIVMTDCTNDKHLPIPIGQSIFGEFASDPVKVSSTLTFIPTALSTIAEAPKNSWGGGIGTPSVIDLQHNGENNGMLIASYAVSDSGKTGKPTSLRTARSKDGGKTWELSGRAYEEVDKSIEASWNPHLFELPCKVGDMPEGTLLLAGISIDAGQKKKTAVNIWRSYDLGESWEHYLVLDTGGVGDTTGGLYEPYLMYENEKLYCFYSDETDKTNHSQKLVFKTSSDGVNWSEKKEMVALEDQTERPGMAVIAKMGNGKYFGIYEVCSDLPDKGATLYYKITDDLDNWDPTDKGTRLTAKDGSTFGSAPWCAWSPVGGDCGMLIISSTYGTEKNDLVVSLDFGKTFTTIANPLPYEEGGYSASLFFSSDGKTLFYSNTVELEAGSDKAKVDFVALKLRYMPKS